MEFTIHKAGIDRARDIAQVQTASWNTTYAGIVPDAFLHAMSVETRRARWAEQLSAGESQTLVALGDASVVGFVSGGAIREPIDGYDGELYAIYLLREFQGQGIGRRLVNDLAAVLRERGFQRMIVWVLEKNPAVGFYARLGGVPVARKTIDIGGVSLQEVAFGLQISELLPNSQGAG